MVLKNGYSNRSRIRSKISNGCKEILVLKISSTYKSTGFDLRTSSNRTFLCFGFHFVKNFFPLLKWENTPKKYKI